jgi:phosphatidylglycerophosphatase C
MDGTLTRADMFLAYLKFVLARRKRRILRCARLPLLVAQYRCGLRSRDRLKEDFLRAVLGGCSAAEIADLTGAFVACYGAGLLKPAALAALDRHRSLGDRLVIASASLDIYTIALAESWRVPEVVSTRTEWRSGKLTGRLAGPNLRGEAKLAAVKQILSGVTGERPEIFAYSDDHSDLPLLRFADHGFAVDPTRKLKTCARSNQLQILDWNSAVEGRLSGGCGETCSDEHRQAPALPTAT